MKKAGIFLICVFLAAAGAFPQELASPILEMDEAVALLAENLRAKLDEKNAASVIIGQFTYQDRNTVFSAFWINQLTGELVNMPNRNYLILTTESAGSEWVIMGEIIGAADAIRVFTRLINSRDKSIEGSYITDFKREDYLTAMLASSGSASSSSGSRSAFSAVDAHEPDSWENPVTYSIGENQNAPVLNRALTEDDEDYFLLIPDGHGRLTIETTGSNIDTYMELFNYDTEEELASDDDSGQGNNARIVYNARAGVRYLAVVRGYDSSDSGGYGFRAYMTIRENASSLDNPISYEIKSGEDNAVSVRRTIQAGDEDYFLLAPDRDGRLIIETTGRLDTFMELYDSNSELVGENDDGGQNSNARITRIVRSGSRYVAMIRGYDRSVSGAYNFRAFFTDGGSLESDEFEPDNDPENAKTIEIGVPQIRTFHAPDDIDWVKFEAGRSGRYVINARGENNNRLDTYLELFDSGLNSIAEDDDSGDSLGARISRNLSKGTYLIKVRCLDENADQKYILSVEEQ